MRVLVWRSRQALTNDASIFSLPWYRHKKVKTQQIGLSKFICSEEISIVNLFNSSREKKVVKHVMNQRITEKKTLDVIPLVLRHKSRKRSMLKWMFGNLDKFRVASKI